MKHSMSSKTKERRERVIERLKFQLIKGTKTPKKSYGAFEIPLTDSDINRINKEIDILKSRI
jgi:hypothetical protein